MGRFKFNHLEMTPVVTFEASWKPHYTLRALARMNARLPGCTPAWMQMVERRREQAAEVVPVPLLWRGARQGGVVEPRLEQAAETNP